MCRKLVYCAAVCLLAWFTTGVRGDDDQDRLIFFENEIRPLLSKHCYSCHGPRKQESDLRLDSRQAMIEGGDSGAVLEPGHPDQSLLLEVVMREDDPMPPGKRLSGREIKALRQWVEWGAPWPDPVPGRDQVASGNRFSPEDRNYWAFQPLTPLEPRRDESDDWSVNEIDYFVWENFQRRSRQPQGAADRRVLLRRVYFDLIGLPPTLAEQDQFLRDVRPDAYERLVDRLLDDPRYGERWARHWLDLVRYAESDGYKQDDFRPNAWRYRDYVIRSFNDDKPYDQFVLEQLAGDELDPENPEYRVATGYLRHWIYEYNQRDARTQWDTILNDVTSVTGDVFLGLSMNCARCHDHKFDPILQEDYFRLKAFFTPLLPRDDLPVATVTEQATYRAVRDRWLQATASIRDELEQIEMPYHRAKMDPEIDKFPLDVRPMMRKPVEERSPFEKQLAALAFRQVKKLTDKELESRIKGPQKQRWQELRAQLREYDPLQPSSLPMALTVTDVGPQAPPTTIPDDTSGQDIEPGVLSILDPQPLEIEPPQNIPSTGRRLALARWMVDPENPLTTRVIVNRIWHYHFGRGLVESTSDFGRMGQPPRDPALLDYLARRFVNGGWSFKKLHRAILLSATYRQTAAAKVDPELRCFQPVVRRLDAEQIRDAMLLVSGELDQKRGGPSVDRGSPSRTIFVKVIRNQRDPLLDAFDAPDHFNSTSSRNVTTTPTQSLLMINGSWTLQRAEALARRMKEGRAEASQPATDKEATAGRDHPDSSASVQWIHYLFQTLFCREPSQEEIAGCVEFLGVQENESGIDAARLTDMCHVLLNSNEFIYVD